MTECAHLELGHGMPAPHRRPDRRQDMLIEPPLVRRGRRLNQQYGCFRNAQLCVGYLLAMRLAIIVLPMPELP